MVRHLFGLGLLLGVFACGCNESQMSGDVAASHIQANVPQDKAFDEDMKRDLAAYLCTSMDCHVEYELLRKGATQTGIAYPKFYVWVHGFQHGKEFTQGAARVAAVDRQQFHVTHFLSQDQIRTSPGQVGKRVPRSARGRHIGSGSHTIQVDSPSSCLWVCGTRSPRSKLGLRAANPSNRSSLRVQV